MLCRDMTKPNVNTLSMEFYSPSWKCIPCGIVAILVLTNKVVYRHVWPFVRPVIRQATVHLAQLLLGLSIDFCLLWQMVAWAWMTAKLPFALWLGMKTMEITPPNSNCKDTPSICLSCIAHCTSIGHNFVSQKPCSRCSPDDCLPTSQPAS